MRYEDDSRGVIQNRKFALQINDFSALKFGKITPTDIDGFMDFGNKHFVYLETKHAGADLPYGQKLALERLCDATTKAGIKSVVIVAEHNTAGDIDVGNLLVKKYYFNGQWTNQFREITVRNAVEKFTGNS